MNAGTYFTVYSASLDSFAYKAENGKYKAGIKGKITPHKFPSIVEAREIANTLTTLLEQAGLPHHYSVITN